MTNCGKQI